jgi:hypothetical protein
LVPDDGGMTPVLVVELREFTAAFEPDVPVFDDVPVFGKPAGLFAEGNPALAGLPARPLWLV